MYLKDHLKVIFKKASLEKNFIVKEDIVIKWVHRFGFESLNDLINQIPASKEEDYQNVKEEQINLIEEECQKVNQEQINLIEEECQKANEEQINLIEEECQKVNEEQINLIEEECQKVNQEQINLIEEEFQKANEELNDFQLIANSESQKRVSYELNHQKNLIKNETPFSKPKDFEDHKKLPLPYIKNLRKWINNDKKAS